MLETIRLLAFSVLAAAWGAGCAPGPGPARSRPPVAAEPGETRVTLLQTTDLHDHGRGAGHVGAGPSGLGGHFDAGRITAEYGSSGDFSRFPDAGGAVRTRNASCPLDQLGALAAMAGTLRQVP